VQLFTPEEKMNDKCRAFLSFFAMLGTLFAFGGGIAWAAGPWFVSPAGNDSYACLSPATACQTISAAIGKASSGDKINVAAGTYTEAGQIVINKNLSIVGATPTSVVIMTDSDTGTTADSKGWFLVNAGMTFNLAKVTLDGSGHKIYQAIRYNGSGSIDNVRFANIAFEPGGPQYNGAGVRIGSSGNVDVTNSTFSNMGRVGVLAEGGTGTFSGNVYTGKGAGDWLDYAYDIEYGSNVTLTNNQISHNRGVDSSDGSTSAAISVWDDAATQVTMNGNTLTDNTAGIGIAIASGASDPVVTVCSGNVFSNGDVGVDIQNAGATGSPTVTIAGSTISGNITGINVLVGMSVSNMSVHTSSIFGNTSFGVNNAGTGVLDATNNWWGSATGPNPPGSGDAVSGNVTVSPWAASPNYSVTYNGNGSTGGSVPTDCSGHVAGNTITVPGNPGSLVRPGYTFAGWNTAADGSGTSYAAGATFAMGSGNVTLYAVWTSPVLVPTLSAWAQILLALLLLGFGAMRRAHRR
jgi:uncharacterized repeat protein (TIGR02543 family)